MSSLFDPSCLWNTLLVPSKGPSSYTDTHMCPRGSVWWDPERTNQRLSFILPFQKHRERRRPRETEREITRRALYIPSNLMAAVVCPVLTRNEFGPQYSPLFSYQQMTYLAWWWEHMRGSLLKMSRCQFRGGNSTVIYRFPEIHTIYKIIFLSCIQYVTKFK